VAFGAPVSTTQTITSTIMGVGATRRMSAIRWGVATTIGYAWLLTLPVTGLLAAGLYLALRPVLG
jgi:PiT family inorganic phosphate transporter